jgi:ribonuclease HI
MLERWKLWFDGACEPSNPGPMSIGALLISPDGERFEFSDRIGHGTNNVAEYRAMIRGLEEAVLRGATAIDVRGDSQLVIRQLTGEYSVKAKEMRAEFNKAMGLLRRIGNWKAFWVPREENTQADALSKKHVTAAVDARVVEAAKLVVVEKLSGQIWSARGSAGKSYAIDLAAMVCSCPDFTRRRRICKHLVAAQDAEKRVA